MKKTKNTIHKKDLDDVQRAFEQIQKSSDKFAVTYLDGGEPSLSVFESVAINRIDDEYLVINMYHTKDNSGISEELQMTCLKDGEKPDKDAEPIHITDIHIWTFNSLNQGTLIYPEVEE